MNLKDQIKRNADNLTKELGYRDDSIQAAQIMSKISLMSTEAQICLLDEQREQMLDRRKA